MPVRFKVNRVLQKKAGLKTDMRRSVVRSSEYQRQFMWKSPSENSPLLAAEQLVYNRNKEVPPFKSGSFVRESEYQRSFKSSPPPKGLKLRKDLEEQEAENISPVSNSKSEKNKTYSSLQNGHIDKDPQLAAEKPVLKQHYSEDPKPAAEKPVVKQCNSEDAKLAAEKLVLKQQNPQRLFFPHRGYGKMKSEYNSNFRSPVKYSYKDGAWIKGLVSSDEVKELKEMAEAYKKRAQGTHFSREHLNQILSEKNRFWEVSSSSTALDLARKSPSDDTEKASLHSGATLPVRRRLAWGDEENEHEEQETLQRSEGEQAQEEKEDEQEKEGRVVGQKSSAKSVSDITPVSSKLSNEDEGRLPTPEMKNQGGAPRTHHDLTTPTVGGALLVSPPKLKPSPKLDLQPEPPLGKRYSPHKYLPRESAERTSTKVDVDGQSRSSIAAGLKTSDPLPLREDSRLADSPPAALRTPSKSSNSTAPPNTGPASLSPHREAQKKNMYRCVLKKVFEFYTAVLKIYSNPDAIGIIDRMNKSLNCTAENCMDKILACDAAILQVKKLDDAMKQVNNIEIQERAISELDRLSGCLARPKKKCI
ncbi:Nuclear protein MDM1 [Acipenser ruthenus]|uniref:Nuclear protein MDM1 n=1 Tax=Acipenser ruthenus TaxID=7906 RepID=A0A444UMV9_ACIRT|nr:Nuclear protein MDM1 [Acipenser ruthenus]